MQVQVELRRTARMTARLYLLISLIGAAILVGILIHLKGYEGAFALWNVRTYDRPFLDLRLITESGSSIEQGYDPTTFNPGDPLQRRFNYPKVWYVVLRSGIDESWTLPIGIAIIGLFIASVCVFPGKVTGLSGALLLLALVSPAVMLAFSRVNVDMLMFTLMTLSLLLVPAHMLWAFGILLVAILLKIIPVLGVGAFLEREEPRSLKYVCGAVLFTLLYCVLALEDMIFTFTSTQKGVEEAYGLAVLPAILRQLVHVREIREGPILLYNAISSVDELFLRAPYLPYLAAFLLLAIASSLGLGRRHLFKAGDSRNLRAFWMGALMYLGTFLIGNNWEYRLIFLVFTLPQLGEWAVQEHGAIRAAATGTLIVLFVSLWHLLIWRLMGAVMPFGWYVGNLVDELANWALFATLAYLIAFSLPEWIFRPVQALTGRVIRARSPFDRSA